MAPGKDQAKIQELSSVHELKEWLIGRVADDNDIVIDELQEEHADMFEMEDEKRGIKVGRGTYLLSSYLDNALHIFCSSQIFFLISKMSTHCFRALSSGGKM